ncbi:MULTISPECIES: aminotransferase class I/II-fold pyridoxal phosphate-dependent enzyme [unclassified Streptomyces]|uniref:aminotransferase class I/II-fold pyridoxal phosphate-dependent enzyme n=1 Tax=unclassified Streptomyces TaxID=2593676 RepID=UPI003813F9C6
MIPPALLGAVESSTPALPPPVEGAGEGYVTVGGQRIVNFSSCDYLGLARHPAVLAAAADALTTWGLGSAAGRVLSGTTVIHQELEQRLARFVGSEQAVLHNSCWSANAGVFTTLGELARRSDTGLSVFSDRLNHASLIDGIRTIRPQVSHLTTYEHHPSGIERLRAQLQEHATGAAPVIVTDGVFSMEGDQAPLRQLVGLAREFGALLVVDDSHGTGVLGEQGRGTPETQGVLGEVDVITSTLGKALGGAGGGFVAATTAFATAVRTHSRPYTFSNNPPYPIVAATLAALDTLESGPELLAGLRRRVAQLREGIKTLGLEALPGEHPIVALVLGGDERAVAVSEALRQHQVYVNPLTHPIVPRGAARIRMQVCASHSPSDIDRLIHALAHAVSSPG